MTHIRGSMADLDPHFFSTMVDPLNDNRFKRALRKYHETWNKEAAPQKNENSTKKETLSPNDLTSIANYYLANYQTDDQIHSDGVYFMLTLLNGDRARESSLPTKISDIQFLETWIDVNGKKVKFEYIRRKPSATKTTGKCGVTDKFAVIVKFAPDKPDK